MLDLNNSKNLYSHDAIYQNINEDPYNRKTILT